MLVLVIFGGTTLAAQAAEESPADAELKEVVVTGSRIVRNGNDAPTPVTVANVDELAANTPSNIPDALNKLPEFSASRGQATLGNGANPGQGNYLNLRAFGINRTLILLDGRRVPATSFDGTINVDTLPQMLIQRVDVVTGGASAVYGSDAVTGVVNYVLDSKYQGLKGVLQGGISDYGDDKSWRVGLAGGTELFGGEGHIIASAEHYDSQGIPNKFDRPYGPGIYQEAGAGTAANPFHMIANGRLSNTSFGGLIVPVAASAGFQVPSSLLGLQFLPNSTTAPFNSGSPTGTTNLHSGGDGGYVQGNAAVAPLVSDQFFTRFQYELSDSVTAFAQAIYAISHNTYQGQNESRPYNGSNSINIYSGNAYLPANVQDVMTANNTPYFGLGRYDGDFGNLIQLDTHNTAANGTVGLKGKFGAGWSWEAFYTHGEGKVRLDSRGNVNNERFYAAIDAVRDNSGNIVCRVTLTNPGLYPGCVPMDILGNGAPSQASINYILGDTWWQAVNTMDDAAANLTGRLGRTWAGPIALATGVEYRRNHLDETTSDDPSAPFVTTGLRGPFTSGTQVWTRNVVAATHGSQDVKEANLELQIPLLVSDVPFAKSLDFDGAIRYTDYSTSGSVRTWKLGLNYQPFDDLRIRANRSRDIRAPSVYELFAGRTVSITGFTDLHTSTGGFTNVLTQGNPSLKPEEANTSTVGFVYTPSWAPGMSLAVDYYNIEIGNAIAAVGGNNATVQQDCETSGGTSPLCALYIRPLPFSDRTAANYPTLIITQNLNIAQTSTHGVDLELGYKTSLPVGMLDARLLTTYQPVLDTRTLPNSQVINLAGAASIGPGSPAPAKLRATLNLTYGIDQYAINTEIRYLSSLRPSGDPTLVYTDPDIPSFVYVDLAVTRDFDVSGHTVSPFLTIDNLFNKQPPLYASTAFTGNPGFFYPVPTGYDIVGRYYTLGVRVKF
jgi:iron complex outermembrane recepter protein